MAAMLHGRNNKKKCFALEGTFCPIGIILYCSWHATWPPCKTSIGRSENTIILFFAQAQLKRGVIIQVSLVRMAQWNSEYV